MVYPGLKKLANELGFKNNGTFCYGFIDNTYLMFADGSNQKNVWFKFPVAVDEEIKQKVGSWKKKGYAKEIVFSENDSFDVMVSFAEYFRPFKISKIKEVIIDITSYFKDKFPEQKIRCFGENCSASENLSVYDIKKIPLPMCHECAAKLQNRFDSFYEELDEEPNNYVRGSIFAFLFSLPGIIVSFIFMMLGKILGISGILYFYLAQKGYLYGKGKQNKTGVCIYSAISFILTILGTGLGYVGIIIKNLLANPNLESIPFIEIVKYAFSLLEDPEIVHELLTNIELSVFLCGFCIVLSMVQVFRGTGKTKVKRAK